MSQIGIERDVLTALAQNEGLPKPFGNDTLKSLAGSDVGLLVLYTFFNGSSGATGSGPQWKTPCHMWH